jgi:hypothetical protein
MISLIMKFKKKYIITIHKDLQKQGMAVTSSEAMANVTR